LAFSLLGPGPHSPGGCKPAPQAQHRDGFDRPEVVVEGTDRAEDEDSITH
jgi:hypothetical protein